MNTSRVCLQCTSSSSKSQPAGGQRTLENSSYLYFRRGAKAPGFAAGRMKGKRCVNVYPTTCDNWTVTVPAPAACQSIYSIRRSPAASAGAEKNRRVCRPTKPAFQQRVIGLNSVSTERAFWYSACSVVRTVVVHR